MTAEPRAYRWDLLPRVTRREQALVLAFAGVWPRSAPGRSGVPDALEPLEVRVGPVRAYDVDGVAERLADPTAVAVVLRRPDGGEAYAVVPGAPVAAATSVLLTGAVDELSAPRAPTGAERGIAAYLAAAVLERYGIEAAVDARCPPASALAARLAGDWVLAVEAGISVAGVLVPTLVVAPERIAAAAPRLRSVSELLAAGAGRLAGWVLDVPVVSGVGRLSVAELGGLAVRDVVLLDDPPRADRGWLSLPTGTVPVAVAEDRVEIRGDYKRGNSMNEAIADDVTVELACQLGTVTLSARGVLELAPGQVLDLSRPLGGPVDLVAGGAIIGQGELVDVEGELGVRVIRLNRS